MRTIAVITIAIALAVIGFGSTIHSRNETPDYRYSEATICGVSATTDVTEKDVFIETADGNIWKTSTDSGYTRGDQVLIKFKTNGTTDMTDDEIVFMHPQGKRR